MRFRRVLLVNPPHVDQGGYKPSPLGLLYLGAYLRKNCGGVDVRMIDGAIEGEWAVIQAIKELKPDLVGISALTRGRHQGLWVARQAKRLLPSAHTVFGNVHPTLMWRQMMEHYAEVDYIVRGEGELTLFELVAGNRLSSIKGLVWRRGKKIIDNPIRPMLPDLNVLPLPAWDMVNPRMYPPRGEGTVNGVDLTREVRFPLIFSRGCIASCTFCSSWMIWKGYRYRNGKLVADEVEMLARKYDAKHFVFQDDTLTGCRDEIILFCKEIIRRKLKIAVYGTTRVDKVDYEMLRYMKRAGFYELSFGIESGSPDMLIKINKRTDLQMIERAIKLTKKAGIITNALMMYGLPRETEKDKELSIAFLQKIKPDETGTVGAVWVFPGTALYEQAKNAKLISDSFWLGQKPYYIYRGGIGGDRINRRMQMLDEINFRFGKTLPFKAFSLALAYKDRFMRKYIHEH